MATTSTPNLGLNLPSRGQENWEVLLNQNFDKLDFTVNDIQAKLHPMTIDGGDFGDVIVNGIALDGGDF